jgi:hypothetical protein
MSAIGRPEPVIYGDRLPFGKAAIRLASGRTKRGWEIVFAAQSVGNFNSIPMAWKRGATRTRTVATTACVFSGAQGLGQPAGPQSQLYCQTAVRFL